jgi:hypothetical protein
LRAVVRAADERGAATLMTAPCSPITASPASQDLVRAIAGPGTKPSAIAELATIVGEAAVAGDAQARHSDRSRRRRASRAPRRRWPPSFHCRSRPCGCLAARCSAFLHSRGRDAVAGARSARTDARAITGRTRRGCDPLGDRNRQPGRDVLGHFV